MDILTQASDDGSLLLVDKADPDADGDLSVKLFSLGSFPSDTADETTCKATFDYASESTDRSHIILLANGRAAPRVVPTTSTSITSFLSNMDTEKSMYIADTVEMALSVWPTLEYQQMYGDAWRMFRDYFYDPEMHQVDWIAVHKRYLPLVSRCRKREELDDVLIQMASELSALHVFVYGGEYNTPFQGNTALTKAHKLSSLGVELQRSPEKKGYTVVSIPETDPDFDVQSGSAIYSPVSDRTLRPSGQQGLKVGDVIVAINGESVLSVPDPHMLLRGLAGRTVRLDVVRVEGKADTSRAIATEPVLAVPITTSDARDLHHSAWVWKTRQMAEKLARKANFTVGYIHLEAMSTSDENDFARQFYPNYQKDALILDVRHNAGGNIDSWILSVLQRKPWMYWGDRVGPRRGSIDWDEQFAFRGHLVVLIDEHSSSDAEGLSRGIAELGLGKLIGTRTWGGGIWLSSDNKLVDGGIASAPEIGTYNDNYGWGLGIEQQGVQPDVEVDNNPRTTFDGKDEQLERAINELADWLAKEPIVEKDPPAKRPNMAMPVDECKAP